MTVSILTGSALILSAFINTASIVQKIAYAQARMEPSSNGVHVANSMTQAPTVVAGALSSVHTTSTQHPIVKIVTAINYLKGLPLVGTILEFKQHKDNCQMGMGPCICQNYPNFRLC